MFRLRRPALALLVVGLLTSAPLAQKTPDLRLNTDPPGSANSYNPQVSASDSAVYAVYPPGRHLSPKVRGFVDLLARHFAGRDSWTKGTAPQAPLLGDPPESLILAPKGYSSNWLERLKSSTTTKAWGIITVWENLNIMVGLIAFVVTLQVGLNGWVV